jgi:hypothetical protein
MNRSSKLVIVAAMILMGLFAIGCTATDDGDVEQSLNLYNWSE